MMMTPSWLFYLLVVCHGLLLFTLGQQVSDGWAVRVNGTCETYGLLNCRPTTEPFSACCPLNSYCFNLQNTVCCQSDTDCTASIERRCAKSEWSLCDNHGYFFCCEQQRFCYAATITLSDGCGDPGYTRKTGEKLLEAVVQDRDATTISTSSISATLVMSSSSLPAMVSSSSISTSSPLSGTSAANAQTSTSSKNNIGAIVGGVVGGIALLVLIIGMNLIFWWQYLHTGSKAKRTQSSSERSWSLWKLRQSVAHEVSGTPASIELDAGQVHELDTVRGFQEWHETGGSIRELE